MDDITKDLVDTLNVMAAAGKSGAEIKRVWDDFRKDVQATDFSFAIFTGVDLSNCNLGDLNLRSASFVGGKFKTTDFSQSDLSQSQFLGSERRVADRLDMRKCNFNRATCKFVLFENCDLTAAKFTELYLLAATFRRCSLQETSFAKADMPDVQFEAVDFGSSTSFQQVYSVKNTTMSRYELACLGESSGLTVGNLMDMNIVDDAAKLREEFGGFWAILHLFALVAFACPYLWFLAYHWSIAHFDPDDTGMTLLEAFARFVVTGGRGWNESLTLKSINWISATSFVTYGAYNAVRGCLLWKAKRLETEQDVKGLPANFSFNSSPRWKVCYDFVRVMFWLAFVSVIFNTINFMLVRLPGN